MKKVNLSILLIMVLTQVMAQDFTMKLWTEGTPNECKPEGEEKYYERNGTFRYENVSEAEIFVYQPDKLMNTGAAVVICPGGAYWVEAIEHEGFQIAEYLKSIGVTGIVLKYRLPYGNSEVPLSDALQAIRLVRSKAGEWGINPSKIGIAGSSAGGHLASTAGTQYDHGDLASTDALGKISSRPDFMLLLYPVISFREGVGHMGSRKNLIGVTNDWTIVKPFCNELWVTDDTPPVFMVLADDDKAVPTENSISFYRALKEKGVAAELHIYAKGGHGFGMTKHDIPVDKWPGVFADWLKSMKIIE
jgi:acetyl esterase/lipase